MGENSRIEWTDHTFNPVKGCTKISPGCANCYAEAFDRRHLVEKVSHWGKGAPRLLASEAMWREPLKWNRQAAADEEAYALHGSPAFPIRHRRPRVFCASHADWLDEEWPVEVLARLLALIHSTPNLDWLLLTKRPGNFFARFYEIWNDNSHLVNAAVHYWLKAWERGEDVPSNVWIGTTVEDQVRADERIPQLLAIPAKVRFLSCEPLLGPVSLGLVGSSDVEFPDKFKEWTEAQRGAWFRSAARATYIARCSNGIHWVICGGESGPGARPMNPQWARDLRDQCVAAEVPFFFKQWGEWSVKRDEDADFGEFHGLDPACWVGGCLCEGGTETMYRMGKKEAGRLLDGREWNEILGAARA